MLVSFHFQNVEFRIRRGKPEVNIMLSPGALTTALMPANLVSFDKKTVIYRLPPLYQDKG